MKASTLEWIKKAEEDWETAQISYRARKVALHNAACFHCQQCIEKYLKARLNEAGIVPQKTHNLSDLLDDVLPAEPNWSPLRLLLIGLTKYAVLYRYPRFDATKVEAKAAIKDCREVRRVIRNAFGLPV
jgi:HEPN domain-containing protein